MKMGTIGDTYYAMQMYYRIEQNFGGKKIWRNYDFEILAEKTLANPRLACIFVLHREFWRKKLGELWRFAKFAKVFSPPKFCSIRYVLSTNRSMLFLRFSYHSMA